MGYSIPKPPIKQQRHVIGYHCQNGLIGNSGNVGNSGYPGVPRTVHLIPNIDLVPEPGFISQTPIQNENEQKLNWWCEKNKTSSDFWKYKL